MEEIEKRRNPLRRRFEKSERRLTQLYHAEEVDRDQVDVEYRLFKSNFHSIIELDSKAMDVLVDTDLTAEQQDKELEEVEDFQRRAETLQLKWEKLVQPPPSQSLPLNNEEVDAAAASGVQKRPFKLPKIQIRTYNGKLTEWLSFWAQFRKVDEDRSMTGSDKLYYLLQYLEPGSEPYQLAVGYPQIDENYTEVITALRKRYGDEDMLLQVYMRELLSLVVTNATSKEKAPLQGLFMKLDTYLRALKTLNLQKADPATWLFPLVESSLPEDLLYHWQRDPLAKHDGSKDNPPKTRLDILMSFLEKEVEIKQRMEITKSFGASTTKAATEKDKRSTQKQSSSKQIPTLVSFHVNETKENRVNCWFCGKDNHLSQDCYKAKRMSIEAKKEILAKKKRCYYCFRKYERKHRCKPDGLSCNNCGGKHFTIMCGRSEKRKYEDPNAEAGLGQAKQRRVETSTQPSVNMVNLDVACYVGTANKVLLQTLMVKISNGKTSKKVRAFLDTGSSRSYLLKSTAKELELAPHSHEEVIHSIFGGRRTEVTSHGLYEVQIEALSSDYSISVMVRDEKQICSDIPRLSGKDMQVWQALQSHQIQLTDFGEGCPTVELLIGASNYGKLLTGEVIHLMNNLVAVNTYLGWTVMGETSCSKDDSYSNLCVELTVTDARLPNLWELELLGIKDPIEVCTEKERDAKMKGRFLETLVRRSDGRYEVMLPWKEGFPYLPNNREIAEKRLNAATRKLNDIKLFHKYSQLFQDWESEGFIEKVKGSNSEKCHYLPHRPVIKTSSLTTPVRPVFDASCRVGKSPSLNDCLHKGENLIQLIPDVLMRFREKAVGIVSDIRKAFQMIAVSPADRDFLRFLWWEDFEQKKIVEYRHARVPFGANCSPFILGAVLEAHLVNLPEEMKETGRFLLNSFYVDNCVCSLDTIEQYERFKETSIQLLKKAGMDLRLWFTNMSEMDDSSNDIMPVLGLLWNRKTDELYVDVQKIIPPETITKRTVLSTVQKIFDPIGVTSPATIPVKKILQQTWVTKMKWDQELSEADSLMFKTWLQQVQSLGEIKLPRVASLGASNRKNWSIHTFVDASQTAYAAVVFLRVTHDDSRVSVQLLAAKSRVAPVKKSTIPRLELLSCLIGARLTKQVLNSLNITNGEVPVLYWSDSTVALAWIVRDDKWGTFVGRRTTEINMLTKKEQWNHVPGNVNPADLPSRGCLPDELLHSKWWEGPDWLKKSPLQWPSSVLDYDEQEIFKEKKREVEVAMCVLSNTRYSYTFEQHIRITGWILRFLSNVRIKNVSERIKDPLLSEEELKKAEAALLSSIQRESFDKHHFDTVKNLAVTKHEDGVLRVRTKLTYRKDSFTFKYPAVLPGNHPLVKQLIMEVHLKKTHAPIGTLITILREKYWIVKARRSVHSALTSCYRCGKYSAKATVTESAPLPEDRVKDSEPFGVTGVDLAGPLILKNQKKVWMVLFTCATYRAVYLQLVDSLSTQAFLKVMKKFVEKFGRPNIIYSDNGTNFHGAVSHFKTLDWNMIAQEEGLYPIQWKFNVSTASWHGGFFERLIRSTKDLIRRMIGKGSVSKTELEQVIAGVAETINSRPLTYVSEDTSELEPLTPNMFLHPIRSLRFPEAELSAAEKLRMRYKHVQVLKKDLQDRWRKEYLAKLVQTPVSPTRPLAVGELVVVSHDNKKRVEWELARILELLPGRDMISRRAKIKTADGIYVRPVQRLHPLELHGDHEKDKDLRESKVRTRSGRKVVLPKRYH